MALVDDFTELLDSDPAEEQVHEFLAAHEDILLRWSHSSGEKKILHSKISLHKYVPDFAVGNFRMTTNRWEWNLIEIERPSFRLFTNKGDPTSELTHALRQVADWRSWIQNNIQYARTVLRDIIPLCDAAVIIGRRDAVTENDRDRLEMLQIQSPGVRITTFDSLIDTCSLIDGAEKK